jgi:hypothetical protein
MFSRVLFPALMEAGAGKQNAVVVIVVRRYAGLAVVSGTTFFMVYPSAQWQTTPRPVLWWPERDN